MLIDQRVRLAIVNELKAASYYSVSIDSTPDISHVELTVVVRYVKDDVERFLSFVNFIEHTGQGLAITFTQSPDSVGIDIATCHGQTYDNTSNVSGQYNGV